MTVSKASHLPAWPVTGRDQPRETGEPVIHDVRFWGNLSSPRDLFAECAPCRWSAWLEGGHAATYLMDKVRQHSGIAS